MAKQTLTSGQFMRSVTSIESHRVPEDAMASGSQNMLVDPVAGGAFKRGGFLVHGYGETLSASNQAVNGILKSSVDWVPRRVRGFHSETLTDGAGASSPVPSVLYSREASSATWPVVDDGVFGTDYVRRPAGNYALLSEFSSVAYPTAGGSHGAEVKYKVVPFWYESGEGGYSRGYSATGADDFQQRFVASGSWNSVDVGKWRYYPNLRSTPIRWDRGSNDGVAAAPNAIRVTPTGPFAPLWAPTASEGSASAASFTTADAEYPWLEGDTFFISVMYQFEDGSYSLPTVPRAPNATLTSGLGFVTMGSAAVASGSKRKFKTADYANIAKGPEGTIARVLLRSKKQNRVTTTEALTIDISDLRVIAVIRNNTQTTYTDRAGDDDSLLQDSDVVRWDLICPPRSRYYGTGDQRVLAGYTLPNASAIQLTMAGRAANYDQNLNDTSASVTNAVAGCYVITSAGIYLTQTTGGAVTNLLLVEWATYPTIQDVVDKINSSVVAVAPNDWGQWRAQIAPGADPFAPSAGICPTVWTGVTSTSEAGTTLTIDQNTYDAIPIGSYVYDASAKVAAGTYVKKKLVRNGASSQVELSAAASGAGSGGLLGVGLKFYANCGDEACVTTAGSKGWIRTFGSAYPGMVYFKRSAMVGYEAPSKERIYFTIGSPGAAATGVSLAANSWAASNRRDGMGETGQIMGIADVQGAALIIYRDKIGIFENQRGVNTGEDFDYRIFPVNSHMGCCSPWSVVQVAGAVVYATPVGIKACDKSRKEILLSGDEFQPARTLGDFAYEIGQSIAAAGLDSPACWMVGAAYGNRLIYSYRRTASTYGFSVYDFSPGADQSGVEALADPAARKPYGWSSVCIIDNDNDEFGPQAIGSVTKGADSLYAALNDNSGTMDGRIDRMLYGSTDNGTSIVGIARGKKFIAPAETRLSVQNVAVIHNCTYPGPVIYMSRVASGVSAGNAVPTSSSGDDDIVVETLQWPQSHRSPGDVVQTWWYDDTANTGGIVWTMEQVAEVLPKAGG